MNSASRPSADVADVAVIGAGIAGLAACVFLRQRGLSVVCLDAHRYPHHKVGESLDWSSPGLLRRLGIDVKHLIADGIATYKKNIVVYETGKPEWRLTPPAQIGWRPLRFETVTLHVDRAALDERVFEHARALGAEFIWERVTGVDAVGERVNGCVTATGRRVRARWYIDATGTARGFSRAMNIPSVEYGRPKVCLWTYFDGPPLHEGTAFFLDKPRRLFELGLGHPDFAHTNERRLRPSRRARARAATARRFGSEDVRRIRLDARSAHG